MISVLYNLLALPLIRIGLWVGRLRSEKLRLRSEVESKGLFGLEKPVGSKRVLFHAASMGELEQVLPVMNNLHQMVPELNIVLSCGSPSGYNHALKQSLIDAVAYLPLDTKRNAQNFVDLIKPDIVVINRYDVWPNFMHALAARCPALLINATFPSVAASPLLRSWVHSFYSVFTEVVAVTPSDADRLSVLCGRNVAYLPDTRIDRVLERTQHIESSIEALRRTDCTTIVCGSTWQEDEDLLVEVVRINPIPEMRLIIVPHEPTESALQRIEALISCTRLSKYGAHNQGHILVDSIGKLVSLYSLADAAYVGGGFGAGVHSTTEPAAFGLAIACGPHIERSRDAVALQDAGILTITNKPDQLLTWLRNAACLPHEQANVRSAADDYFRSRSGSSQCYADTIASYITDRS